MISDNDDKEKCVWKPIKGKTGSQSWCNNNCKAINGKIPMHCKEICQKVCGNKVLNITSSL